MSIEQGRLGGMKAALLCGVAALLLSPAAATAQDAKAAPPKPATAAVEKEKADKEKAEKAAEAAQEIIVVGSRIRRDSFNPSAQVQVVTREESTQAGMVTAAEILQGTNVTNGASQINNLYGNFVTNGGPGVNTLSLRGLGSTRTLVLINGRRVAPAGSRGAVGASDLNVLPSAIVERVEILRDGASSVYGSDAIAGVVNIITRSDIDGIEASINYNRPVKQGGERANIALIGGTRGDRWKVAGSAEYYERRPLLLSDREWARCNADYFFDPATRKRADFIDPLTGQPKCYTITGTGSNGVTINTLGTASAFGVGAPGSVGTIFNRWRPNAAVTTGIPGFEGVGGGANSFGVRDTFEPRMLNRTMISPTQNATGFLQASYETDILGDAEIFTESLATRRKSQQTGYRQLSLDYPQRSPLVPVLLQQYAGNFGSELHSGPGLRAFIGFGNDYSRQRVDFTKNTVGVRGDISLLQGWKYEIDTTYSRSSASYVYESFLTDRLANSLNVVTAPTGTNPALTRQAANGISVTCAVNVTNPAAGCIPAPILNSQTLGGKLPKDWVDYVWLDVASSTVFTDWTSRLGLDGPLFTVPAGKVRSALGVEYRRERINDTPNENSQKSNLYGLTSATPTRGRDSVIETYGELEVPILKGLPAAEELTLNGSARWTRYNSYGSGKTYRLGTVYSPVDFLTFRGTMGTSYRAPELFEQYQGATSGFASSNSDPCNNYGATGVNEIRARNCASELPGQPNFLATSSIKVLTQGGADANLKAETSRNYTVGGVITPELPEPFGRFAFSADYFSIKVKDGVSQVGAGSILSLCYDDKDFRAGGGFCRLVTRAKDSNALTVVNSYINISSAVVKGFDYNLRWTGDVGPGLLRLNAAVTRFSSQAGKLFKDDPLRESNGLLGAPERSGSFDATYKLREWSFYYGLNWVAAMSSMDYYGFTRETTKYVAYTPNYFVHSLSVGFQQEDWGVTVGVRNLLDKEPPKVSADLSSRIGESMLNSNFDYYGREIYVSFSKKF